ncbi:hypothetical protein ACVR1I_02720 [Streptococcus cameli]
MAIHILRRTGILGPWGQLFLAVDQTEISPIENNQSIRIELPYYPAKLEIVGDAKSAIVTSNHQFWILENHPLYQILCCLALLLGFFSWWLPVFWLKISCICFALLLSLIAMVLVPRFRFRPVRKANFSIKELSV